MEVKKKEHIKYKSEAESTKNKASERKKWSKAHGWTKRRKVVWVGSLDKRYYSPLSVTNVTLLKWNNDVTTRAATTMKLVVRSNRQADFIHLPEISLSRVVQTKWRNGMAARKGEEGGRVWGWRRRRRARRRTNKCLLNRYYNSFSTSIKYLSAKQYSIML